MAQPTADQLAQAWSEHVPAIQSKAFHDLNLNASDFATLAKGKVARRRLPDAEVDRAMGVIWTSEGRDKLWVAIQDDQHFTLVDNLTEIRLADTPGGHKQLYGHLDFPWPVADRHWVLEIKNNTALAKDSQNRIWERVWDLTDEAAVPKGRPEAIWSPVNDGGWFLVDACGGTLIIYHARSKIGGNIPQEVITTWAMTTVDGLLKKIVERAQKIPGHYTAGHVPLTRPDGSAVPTW